LQARFFVARYFELRGQQKKESQHKHECFRRKPKSEGSNQYFPKRYCGVDTNRIIGIHDLIMTDTLSAPLTLESTHSWVANWLQVNAFNPLEMDCVTAVMLKILDGKCKMPANEKFIMEQLYRQSFQRPGHHLNDNYHNFIAPFLDIDRSNIAEAAIMEIYEQRVLAETQISRPVMKAFKGRLRKEGLLPRRNTDSED